ncbi:MAG: glycosyltransferase [Candidatus Woesebacteria bacterium]|nr:MAG: glycosyltransferase [Candidatus Woesebacteria bacterium]
MRNFAVITLNRKNITDFAASRNHLLKSIKSEWILFLDSDEVISKDLKSEIKKLNTNGYNGFYLNRKNYFLGQYVGTDKILRLGKNNAGTWERGVHETWHVNGRIGEIKNAYIVHNTSQNLQDYLKKINYYSELHALENIKEGKKSNLFKIVFYPIGKFIVTFAKSGNVVFSIMQSLHSFLSWSKQWIIQNA